MHHLVVHDTIFFRSKVVQDESIDWTAIENEPFEGNTVLGKTYVPC